MKGKVALHNLGCKVNAYETEAMQQMLEAAGYEIVPFEPGADIYVINTCTVTNIADRKSRQMLHKAKKMNPDAIVVAAGCYVQADTKKAEADASIDIIIGNNKKQELISILENYRSGQQKTTECVDINHTKEYEKLEIDRTEEHTRAYLKVQDGCNQFCSYCIIPYARGRVRSRRKEEVVEEVKTLAGNGCKEVVLTGIHLSSYGIDHGSTLQELILAVHEVAGVERIRLGSLEPGIITENFVKTLSALPKFCPHFHLSLAIDISPFCDCYANNDASVVPDVGMFASFDPVAIDVACADLVNQQPPIANSRLGEREHEGDHFHTMHPVTNWRAGTEHGEAIGLGSTQYELVVI